MSEMTGGDPHARVAAEERLPESSEEAIQRLGGESLEALDALLDEKQPGGSYQKIAAVVRCLVRLRDHLIQEKRATDDPEAGERLKTINSILSLASSAEYPLIGVRWKRISMTRDAIEAFLRENESRNGQA